MKITIYLSEKYVEKLYLFLFDGNPRKIKWHSGRLTPKQLEVTISYDDYMKLLDLNYE